METLRRPLAALGLAAVLALSVAACSGDADEPARGVPSGEVQPLEAGVPAQWRERWCDARRAATGEEAVELLGAPTDEQDLGRQRMLTWQHEQEVSLSLVLDAGGAVVDRSSSVASGVPADVAADLECAGG